MTGPIPTIDENLEFLNVNSMSHNSEFEHSREPPMDNPIFCKSSLLEEDQMMGGSSDIFNESIFTNEINPDDVKGSYPNPISDVTSNLVSVSRAVESEDKVELSPPLKMRNCLVLPQSEKLLQPRCQKTD